MSLTNKFSPHIIALHETHFAANKTTYIPYKYIGHFHKLAQNNSAKEDTALFIHLLQVLHSHQKFNASDHEA